jgi:cysteine desulfuration protein SufE
VNTPITYDQLLDELAHLEDADEKCDFLIDLGMELQKLPDAEKTEQNRVQGCQSNVWMTNELSGQTPPHVVIHAESDAMIVNGLIAALLAIYNEKTPQQILETDIRGTFEQLGLFGFISPQRRNGLFGMVERIRQFAHASL